jgi:hypothetical protein
MSVKIHNFCAHPIDRSLTKVVKETIPTGANLDKYIAALVELTTKEEDTRHFSFAHPTTEVRASLTQIRIQNQFNDAAETIASRLLRVEKMTADKVAHLRGVQNGILLQSLFERESESGILIAKVDWARFLPRGSYRDAEGIDYKPRLLKACLVLFSAGDTIADVQIADTNATLSTFWWKEFLELEEQRTDDFNTKTVFATFDTFLGNKIRSKHPADYAHLFNHMLGIFKRTRRFLFKSFVNEVFDGYQATDPNLDVQQLKQDALRLITTKKFDGSFNLNPKVITKRFKRTYELTDEIELQISDSIENLASTIYGLNLNDGTKGVFVKSEKGYQQFLRPPVSQSQQKSHTANIVKKVNEKIPNQVHQSQ